MADMKLVILGLSRINFYPPSARRLQCLAVAYEAHRLPIEPAALCA